jgi:RNA polymerase sigma factor (sigma-70 family)
MQELDDNALLREYKEHDSEAAFATLVARHVNKVYSVALRHTRNPHQAEEITQAVFVILARKSRHLGKRVILSGWLYQTARLTAVTFIRSEIRRARREQEAHMQTLFNESESDVWPQIAPLLDAAMAGLSEVDRHAVVLRFFDGKSMKEIGVALGASEDAAKMRLNRAVEKLRLFFTKRGVVLPAAVLTAAISANSVSCAGDAGKNRDGRCLRQGRDGFRFNSNSHRRSIENYGMDKSKNGSRYHRCNHRLSGNDHPDRSTPADSFIRCEAGLVDTKRDYCSHNPGAIHAYQKHVDEPDSTTLAAILE